MRITQDAIDELGSESLEKAVEEVKEQHRKTVRLEDVS